MRRLFLKTAYIHAAWGDLWASREHADTLIGRMHNLRGTSD